MPRLFVCYECAKIAGCRLSDGCEWYSQVTGGNLPPEAGSVTYFKISHLCYVCKQPRNFIVEAEFLEALPVLHEPSFLRTLAEGGTYKEEEI